MVAPWWRGCTKTGFGLDGCYRGVMGGPKIIVKNLAGNIGE